MAAGPGPGWFATPAAAEELLGRVIAIQDGDTLTLLTPEHQAMRIRLDQIDAPELGQPHGATARRTLSALVMRREVRVVVNGIDRYGRVLGQVWAGPLDVNAEMLRHGAAWAYRQYLRDPGLVALETSARQASVGLWALPPEDRVPPWQWRHQR